MKMLNNKKINIIIVALVATLFFFGASAFNYFTQSYGEAGDFVKWTSPDETANYVFTKLYGQEGRITITEDYNLQLDDVMRPRSFRSDHGVMKPVSFLGVILVYGKIVSLTSYKILPFLTPFLASLGIIFYYLLIRRIFSEKVALISALLLSVFPPFVYYSARSMFHNIPLVVYLIIGLYFSVIAFSRPMKQKFLSYEFKLKNYGIMLSALLGGFFIGLSIITRTSELMWIGPIFFITLLLFAKKVNHLNLPLIICGIVLAVLPMAYHNQILYGSPILGGYAEMNRSIIEIVEAGSKAISAQEPAGESGGLIKALQKNVFLFGFHERFSLKMLQKYFIEMFPFVFWTAIGGLLVFFINFKKIKYKQAVYLGTMALASGFLVLYYGSWEFHDNPDPSQYTIGNSYTRYWLPMYLGLIPFAAIFLDKVRQQFSELVKLDKLKSSTKKFLSLRITKPFLSYCIIIILLFYYFIISATFVVRGSDEGLLPTALRQIQSQNEQAAIFDLTESNSVIITRYHDKLLFPERKVIVGLFDDQAMNWIYAKITEKLPVYYYNFELPEKDFEYLNNRRLKEVGLGIRRVKKITDDFALYELVVQGNK